MIVEYPLVLLCLLPLAAVAWAIRSDRVGLAATLPGKWQSVVAARLRPYIAARMAGETSRTRWFPLAALGVTILALSKPVIITETVNDPANLAGRAVIVDMGDATQLASQKSAVEALLTITDRFPAALIAVSEEAYTAVPLTTDRAHLQRYLTALTQDTMPALGRVLQSGWSEAERVLVHAGIAAGQIVLVAAGSPPSSLPAPFAGNAKLAIVPLGSAQGEWLRYADAYDATIVRRGHLDELDTDLTARANALARDSEAGNSIDLSPWLIAIAAGLALPLFRRRIGD